MNDDEALRSTAWYWALIAIVAALGTIGIASTFAEYSMQAGWRQGLDLREVDVIESQVESPPSEPGRGAQVRVWWRVPGSRTLDSSVVEVRRRAQIPRVHRVVYDTTTGRWHAHDLQGEARWQAGLSLVALVLIALTAVGATALTITRYVVEHTPREVVIDPKWLESVAKQRRVPWLITRAIAGLVFYLGLHFLSLILVALALTVLGIMASVGRYQLFVLGLCLATLFPVARVYWNLVRAKPAEPAGVRMTASEHPAFFAELTALAARCGTQCPDEVYLEPGRNAGVREESRLLGLLGGKRTLVLGSTLLHAITVGELRAIVAHEFGHFVGGDTRLGALIYAVRLRAISMIQEMSEPNALNQLTRALGVSNMAQPYIWYLEVFLAATRKLSRTQELLADRMAIEVAGRDGLLGFLRRSGRGALASQLFFQTEMSPLLADGFVLQDIDRLELAYEARAFDAAARAKLDEAMMLRPADPFDTHPADAERIAFADYVVEADDTRDDRPALMLFDEVWCRENMERFIRVAYERALNKRLHSITFEESFWRIHLPQLQHASYAIQRVIAGDDGGLQGLGAMLDPRNALALCQLDNPAIRSIEGYGQYAHEQVRRMIQARIMIVLSFEPGTSVVFEISQPYRVKRADGSVVTPWEIAGRLMDHPDKRDEIMALLSPPSAPSEEPSGDVAG
ncbi:MAG: M48 family metalloprotease [Deltaproteobacteria bacterium]|nr:M48 family metalloprotease [Deltaproteobacteria bacterium]